MGLLDRLGPTARLMNEDEQRFLQLLREHFAMHPIWRWSPDPKSEQIRITSAFATNKSTGRTERIDHSIVREKKLITTRWHGKTARTNLTFSGMKSAASRLVQLQARVVVRVFSKEGLEASTIGLEIQDHLLNEILLERMGWNRIHVVPMSEEQPVQISSDVEAFAVQLEVGYNAIAEYEFAAPPAPIFESFTLEPTL